MMRVVCLFLLMGSFVFAEAPKVVSAPVSEPASVLFSIDEGLLSGLIPAMGTISGTTTVNVPLLSGKAYWTVKNPKIQFLKNDSFFSANVEVKMGLLGTNSEAKGAMDVTYNVKQNMITLSPRNAYVDLFFNVFGQRVTFARLDVAKLYKKPICFAGPELMKSGVVVPMPDGTTKQLFLSPERASVQFQPKLLTVGVWLKPEFRTVTTQNRTVVTVKK